MVIIREFKGESSTVAVDNNDNSIMGESSEDLSANSDTKKENENENKQIVTLTESCKEVFATTYSYLLRL